MGPKVAHLYLQVACDKVLGIPVDTHVHRIVKRLGWVGNTASAEQTRRQLESWLPHEHWCKINKLLVGFGQQVCRAVDPDCRNCPVSSYCAIGQSALRTKPNSALESREPLQIELHLPQEHLDFQLVSAVCKSAQSSSQSQRSGRAHMRRLYSIHRSKYATSEPGQILAVLHGHFEDVSKVVDSLKLRGLACYPQKVAKD